MGYSKLIQSGKLVEIYDYQLDYIPRSIKSRTRKTRCKRVASRNRRPDNLFRLKRYFERIVRSNLLGGKAPLFVTLTMYETVPIRLAYRSFSRFIQRLRARYGKDFRYVAVPEFQGDVDFSGYWKALRGAVHFHVLFWFLPITEQGERQKRYIQWSWRRGFVDCVQTDGSVKLAGYMSKYVFKAMYDERLGNQKAYVCSRNILRPVSVSYASAFRYLNDIVGDSLPDHVSNFNSAWLGNCQYRRYVL